jgi:hypothetical protein
MEISQTNQSMSRDIGEGIVYIAGPEKLVVRPAR